MDEVQLHHTAE